MKIGYFFITSKKFHEERTRPLYNTVVKRIIADSDHAFFLSGVRTFDDIPLIKVSGGDGYGSCPPKFFSVFKNKLPEEYDWFLFADDDTFIDTKKLKQLCSTLSTESLEIHGKIIRNGIDFPHGGAGILMNRYTFTTIKKYCDANGYPDHFHSDIGLYNLTEILKILPEEPIHISIIDNPNFTNENDDREQLLTEGNWITMHMKGLDSEKYDYNTLESLITH